MEIPALQIVIPDPPPFGAPFQTLQNAIDFAAKNPQAVVWIPPTYPTNATFVNPNNVVVFDMRQPPSISFITGGGGGGSLTWNVAPLQTVNFNGLMGNMYLIQTGSSLITVTLPGTGGVKGQSIFFKKVDSGIGTVLLSPSVGTIDGLANFTLRNQFQYMGLVSDGSNWQIFTRN